MKLKEIKIILESGEVVIYNENAITSLEIKGDDGGYIIYNHITNGEYYVEIARYNVKTQIYTSEFYDDIVFIEYVNV